jgi:hypothetical protein
MIHEDENKNPLHPLSYASGRETIQSPIFAIASVISALISLCALVIESLYTPSNYASPTETFTTLITPFGFVLAIEGLFAGLFQVMGTKFGLRTALLGIALNFTILAMIMTIQ